jgi:hypothetical protein
LKSRIFVLLVLSSSLLAQAPPSNTIRFEDATAKSLIQFTHSFGAQNSDRCSKAQAPVVSGSTSTMMDFPISTWPVASLWERESIRIR